MTRWIEIDDHYPRPDRVQEVVGTLRRGQIVAMATDTSWVVACDAMSVEATRRLQALRTRMSGASRPDEQTPMSIVCPDLATVGTYALVDQPCFRALKRHLPGPYTFILPASRQVPRQIQSKRRAIGIRIPEHPVAAAIATAFDGPLFVATCRRPDGTLLDASPAVESEIGDAIDVIVESLPIEVGVSTVVDWTDGFGRLVREGKGEVEDEWVSAQ